jgi:hypothetical protein
LANKNPVQGRLARKRKRQPGNLQDLMQLLWKILEEIAFTLEGTPPADQIYRAGPVAASCANAYSKLLLIG